MSESFEKAFERVEECVDGVACWSPTPNDWCKGYEKCGDCQQAARQTIDRLKAAHEHELEQLRKTEYARGYADGQRSMDAEHRAIAIRLMQVPYDDDAMEFLFHISAIICGGHYASNKLLRDELVRLLGGVHEPDAALPTYDELEDERQAAVCWLQDWDPHDSFDNDRQGEVQIRILYQLLNLGGAMMIDGADAAVAVRDKLIHLLGGEPICQNPRKVTNSDEGMEPYLSFSPKTINKDESECESVPVSPDSVENRQDVPKRGNGVTQNDDTASITDELRKYVQTDMKRDVSLLRIADRIESEFARLLKQQDDAWQATCEQLSDEHEKEIAELRSAIVGYKERADALEESERLRHELERERDELLDLLRDARDDYKMLDKKSAETSVNFHAMRDRVWGLQAKLDEYDQTHIELPKDADGEYIHVGDRLWYGSLSDIVSYVSYEPNNKYLETDWSIGTEEDEFDYEEVDGRSLSNQLNLLTHRQPPDPIERLVTQHTLGNLDEQQLIDQLREVMNGRR